MAVKKAISSIDLLIQEKKDFRTKVVGSELPPPIQGDIIKRFDRAMWSMLQGDIEWLQSIKRQLLPELGFRHARTQNLSLHIISI